MNISEIVLEEIIEGVNNTSLRLAMNRAIDRLTKSPFEIYSRFPYLREYSLEVRKGKEEVLKNIDYYIDKTIKSVEENNGIGIYARNKKEIYSILDEIIGLEPKIIVKAKSMVSEELEIRTHLENIGHEVYETDLGQFLIQLSKDKPMHTVAPAIHMTREKTIELLNNLGLGLSENASISDIVNKVRIYLREKFIDANIGMSGANSISADTGAIFLISNEGNIRNSTNLPPIHIVITGIEKIMPNMELAYKQALIQAANAGLYPPTYLSIIAGPSSTADIEFKRVYGVHGPRKQYVILYDGGRRKALEDITLSEQLYCVRCGRCQAECPIWQLVGNIWGGSVYGGPMGIGWTAITEGIEEGASLARICLLCGRCKEICPVDIDLPRIIHYLKNPYSKQVLR